MFLKGEFFFNLIFFINKINAPERNPAVRVFYKQHHVLYTWLLYGVFIFYFVLLCFFTASAMSEIVRETPVSAVIDAHDAIGQPVSVAAMQMAIDKAKKAGVGIVVVRDSNHYGIAGYYAKMAADQGLLGISMTNTEALVVPTFSKQPMMGTNPIAVSMPGTPHPFHLDMATSVVPAGKMEVYAKAGKTLPGDWLMNSDGSPSYDPNDFLRIRATKSLGGIFPVGGEGETNSGHKGYGLSLLVELFCGILSGGLVYLVSWLIGSSVFLPGRRSLHALSAFPPAL